MITSAGSISPLPLRPAGAAPSTDSAPEPHNPANGAEQENSARPAATAGRDPIRPLINGGLLTAVQAQDPGNAPSAELKDGVKDGDGKTAEDSKTGTDELPAKSSTAGPSPEPAEDPAANGLSEEQKAEVAELKSEDTRVRNHEAAHASAGGAHAGSPQFSYTTGPDGKRYATSGSVPIDVAPVAGDPEATIRKMDQVKRAALAPADPSGADRSVAAQADQTKQQAQREAREARELQADEVKPNAPDEAPPETPDQQAGEIPAAERETGTAREAGFNQQSGPEFGHRRQPDIRDSGGDRDFADVTETTGRRENDSGSELGQSQANFAQAIEAYQRAGNASAGPRISSLR